MRVPEDVSVVGYDDIPAATLVSPTLTTVTVPLARLGRAAVDLLIETGSVPTATESALAAALTAAERTRHATPAITFGSEGAADRPGLGAHRGRAGGPRVHRCGVRAVVGGRRMTATAGAPRLSRATLSGTRLPSGVQPPAVDPADVSVGLVHLGLGAFHRAHQAVFTEDAAAATGENGWGILGVTQRSARVVEQLAPQDGLYGVLTKGTTETSLRLVGSLRDVAFPGTDTPRVLTTIAAPTTHVVTLTVTEKGYRRAADGRPDLADPDLAADLDALASELRGGRTDAPARSPLGLLLRGLALRARHDAGNLTVVCCDNLADNGAVLATLVGATLDAVPHGDRLREWIDDVGALPGHDGRPDRARDDRRAPRRGAVAPRAERRRPGDRRTVHAVGHPGHVRRAAPGVGARRGDAHRRTSHRTSAPSCAC